MAQQESKLGAIIAQFKQQTYESEFTRFMRDYKQQKPQTEAEQRKSRAIWWDHPQDLDTQKRARESRVRQKAYVYQTKV